MMDLELLRFVWWLLIGVLIMGFTLTDGWDIGMAAIYPLVARTDLEKRVVLNVIGPFWEGNQVWIILAAGALFAAWPFVYAIAFSGFYLLILLLLLTLGISRPVSFKYRSKMTNVLWRNVWDHVVFWFAGVFPGFILGVLVGNVLIGMPFNFNASLQASYSGSFFDLFNTFTLWCGLTSLVMFAMHGGLYLAIKSEEAIARRATLCARFAAALLLFFFVTSGLWLAYVIPGYMLTEPVDHYGFSNPLNKQVTMQVGAWLNNFYLYPYTMLAPALGVVGAMFVCAMARSTDLMLAFACSCLSIIGIIATIGFCMFPFILPSYADPNSSLLVWDASSSALTLLVMLVGVIIFIPIILMYTSWVFYALRGKVKEEMVASERQAY